MRTLVHILHRNGMRYKYFEVSLTSSGLQENGARGVVRFVTSDQVRLE